MRILVTGHNGYIGCSLVPLLVAAGHEVTGLDSYLFAECTLGPALDEVPAQRLDIRDVRAEHLAGYDAVVHLAGVSKNPLGDLRPEITHDINYRGAVRVAQAAKEAGVSRFIFFSSSSLYGAHGDTPVDERAALHPVTPHDRSKVMAERDICKLADDSFSPTFLRNGTAYGLSSRLRGDLLVNNLTGFAFTTGEVLLKGDGSPWRSLVHIEDIARAALAVLEASRDQVHGEAFNVGRTEENYRVREVAAIVYDIVPACTVVVSDCARPEKRNYRVSCDKIAQVLPSFQTRWTVPSGVTQLYRAYLTHGLTEEDLTGRLQRICHIQDLTSRGMLDDTLRWSSAVAGTGT